MASSKAAAAAEGPKHRACDECRSRKLGCSKEADGCTRCKREGITCYYSPQKPMGRPRKRPAANHNDEQPHAQAAPAPAPSRRRRRQGSPVTRRSGSVSSSTPSTVPEMHTFQLGGDTSSSSSSTTSTTSFSDANLSFLDQQAATPDLTFFDLLPGCFQDGGIPMTAAAAATAAAASSQPVGCSSTHTTTTLNGMLPMATQDAAIGSTYTDMAFLDPAFALGSSYSDGYDACAYGATPALSAGSHTPYNSEPSYSPPPPTHRPPPLPPQYLSPDEHHAAAAAAGVARTELLRPIPTVACACLSSLYMALESLSNLPRDIPAAMRITRHASRVSHSVIACKTCSSGMQDISRPPTMQCFQNMMLLAALVPSACNAYTAIVEMVDRECRLAVQQGRTIYYSAREIGGPWDHGAVGGAGAGAGGVPPAGIREFDNTELAPHEWRTLMLAIIRLDVYGNKEQRPGRRAGARGLLGLSDVVAALDERASRRHELIDAAVDAGVEPNHHAHFMMTPRACRPEDRNCVRVLQVARLALNNLVIA